jgi:hypothetical protein
MVQTARPAVASFSSARSSADRRATSASGSTADDSASSNLAKEIPFRDNSLDDVGAAILWRKQTMVTCGCNGSGRCEKCNGEEPTWRVLALVGSVASPATVQGAMARVEPNTRKRAVTGYLRS